MEFVNLKLLVIQFASEKFVSISFLLKIIKTALFLFGLKDPPPSWHQKLKKSPYFLFKYWYHSIDFFGRFSGSEILKKLMKIQFHRIWVPFDYIIYIIDYTIIIVISSFILDYPSLIKLLSYNSIKNYLYHFFITISLFYVLLF